MGLTRGVLNRLQTLLGVGLVRLINNSGAVQKLQVRVGPEVLDDIAFFESYGFTFAPHDDAECLVASLGGKRDRSVVIKVGDRRYRLKGLKKGEVALYTDEGDSIVLKRGREIAVTAGTKLTVSAPDSEFTGNVSVGGNMTVAGNSDVTGNATVGGALNVTGIITGSDVKAGSISLLTHKHGGVTAGDKTTGEPQ